MFFPVHTPKSNCTVLTLSRKLHQLRLRQGVTVGQPCSLCQAAGCVAARNDIFLKKIMPETQNISRHLMSHLKALQHGHLSILHEMWKDIWKDSAIE